MSQMFLLPDCISFADEPAEFLIQIGRLFNSEMVNVIAPGNRVDPPKARLLVSLRQNQMPHQRGASDLHSGEGHAHLESDSGLFRHDNHRAAASHPAHELFIKFAYRFRFPLKMCSQLIIAAEVRLIPVRELPPALRTAPHGQALRCSLPLRKRREYSAILCSSHIAFGTLVSIPLSGDSCQYKDPFKLTGRPS